MRQSNSQKHLALICQHFYPEMISTGMHMTELATGLSRCGWQIRVYCAQPSFRDVSQSQARIPSKMEYEGVDIIRVPTFGNQHTGLLFRGLNAVSFLFFVALYLIRDHSLLAGIFNTTNPPFLGLAAILTRWLTGLRFVTLVYDVYPDVAVCIGVLKPKAVLTKFWESITRFILRWSDALITIGDDMKDIVRSKLKEDNQVPIVVIRNWSDHRRVYPVPENMNPFVDEHGLANNFVIQYSGRMGLTHNVEPLIDAARILQEEPIIFQFIGDGAKREQLHEMVSEYKLKNVQFLPYQPFENLMNVLSAPQMAVVCLTTSCSGFSVPSKSYGIMAAACPILGFLSRESEIGKMIEEHGCGIVMPDPSGEEVTNEIRALISDPERIHQMGQKGYNTFIKNYTLDHAIEHYSRFLIRYFPKAKKRKSE